MNKKRYKIGKVFISITNPQDAKMSIEKAVSKRLNTYICVSNVRTVIYANKHEDYLDLMNNSYMNIPDGMPLIWAARIWKIKNAQRTMGPELFKNLLVNSQNNIKHFLLGDTPDTLQNICDKLKKENQSLIAGTLSPPFCSLDEYDYQHYAQLINESNADVVWVSMTAPKQDYFAVRLLPYLKNKTIIGVGAAFRLSLKREKQLSKLIQQTGLTGFFIRQINIKLFVGYFKLLTEYFPLLYIVIRDRLSGKSYFEQ
jgi:N-acetylglucosaminyldiphosphoundecaprenol N-acetyl-beta-D-mannosaminyltransferase